MARRAPGRASSRQSPGAGAGRGAAGAALYKGRAKRHVKPVIGNVRLDKLTPAHVQRLVTETRNSTTSRSTPPSASTLRHVYKLVRNALGDAFRMELVTTNVATQVKAPPLNNKRRSGLDLAEAKRLLKVIDGERPEALYVLALTTGLRRGELLALRWDDIDLGSRQLHVRRAMQREDGKLQIAEPKTSSARRTVVLPQLAIRHLEEHKERQELSASHGVRRGENTGWCSLHPSGP